MGKKIREAQDLMNADLLVGQKVLEDKLSETQEWVGRLSEQVAHLAQIMPQPAGETTTEVLGVVLAKLDDLERRADDDFRAIQTLQSKVERLEKAQVAQQAYPSQIFLDEVLAADVEKTGAKVDALGHELSELEAKHHRELQKLDERVRFVEAAVARPPGTGSAEERVAEVEQAARDGLQGLDERTYWSIRRLDDRLRALEAAGNPGAREVTFCSESAEWKLGADGNWSQVGTFEPPAGEKRPTEAGQFEAVEEIISQARVAREATGRVLDLSGGLRQTQYADLFRADI